jgi:beta-lactamase class A
VEDEKIIVPEVKHKKALSLIHYLLIFSLLLNIFLAIGLYHISYTGNTFRLVNYSGNILLDSDTQNNLNDNLIIHYDGLKDQLLQEIKKYNATDEVGVFLQDINTGTWLGINEKEGFLSASLLKLPIMMATLKKVERGEIKLTDKITLIQDDLNMQSGDLYKKGAGAKVSVEDLLEEMILSSDNTAKQALVRQLSDEELSAVLIHVGISMDGVGTISPRDYLRMFKALYYSTFLTPALSEKALDLTTDTQEENLISAGVPYEIQVAHKFGVLSQEKQLHDCGIIYYPKNPYTLCVMTKGMESADSKKLIQTISKDIFEFVDKKENNKA